MSPVSRGRKRKKKDKKRRSGQPAGSSARAIRPLAYDSFGTLDEPGGTSTGAVDEWIDAKVRGAGLRALQDLLGISREQPEWYKPSVASVVDRADALMAATGPRQLEQATVELVGAEVVRVAREESKGLWFDWWFSELVDAAAARVQDAVGGDAVGGDTVGGDTVGGGEGGAWEAPWRLLHGLTSIGFPPLAARAQDALDDLADDVADAERRDPAGRTQPEWLPQLAQITATGDVWEMHDVYGTRFGLIAGFSYPGGVDPSVFLYDIDACGFVVLANAGAFDDVEQAAAAWREIVGAAAVGAAPTPVETVERLYSFGCWDSGEIAFSGDESQSALENWFRARRREYDLAEALEERGMLPAGEKTLREDRDAAPLAMAFTDWYVERHGGAEQDAESDVESDAEVEVEVEPDPEAVDALAEELVRWAMPGTEYATSPHRAGYQHTMFEEDWDPEHPITIAMKALLPEWVRWLGERAGLPEHLVDRAVAVAAGDPLTEQDCPGAAL